ncbi:MAG: type VI secretion system protein TssA [Thermodesulfovibrionia bacterium]|nr:type VI secretion system protein TssA [Thermodesulfovibrionia bacterium]
MELTLLGREPVSADQPAGMDVRYEPVFEELQAEMDKLASPSSSGALDWNKVERLSSEILARKSKDLLAASYFAVALIYTRKTEGLVIGLRVYRDLLEQFWDDLFPSKTRMRGRIGAIEWWLEKTGAALKQFEEVSLSSENLKSLKENLEKIDEFLNENIAEPPSLRPIKEFLNSVAVPSVKEKEEKEETKPQAVAAAHKEEILDKITSREDVRKVFDTAIQKIREATAFLRENDLSNPQLYRWTRIAAWSSVSAPPPATNGKTLIPPPGTSIRDPLDELRNRNNPEAFVRLAGERLLQYVFWLDLNRWITEALNGMGDQFRNCSDAVCQETALFVHRLQGLEELTFSDGTPFADDETRQWLNEIAFGRGSAVSDFFPSQESGSTQQDEDLIQKEVKEAQALIKKKKIIEAIDRFQQKIYGSFSQKEKLLWRLAISQLMVNSNKSKLVLPHLEQILKDVETYRLEEYDPKLALECFKLVWQGLSAQTDDNSKKKAEEMLRRIARIDMTEVIRLGKG